MGELFEQILNGEFDYPEEYWSEISEDGIFLKLLLLMISIHNII